MNRRDFIKTSTATVVTAPLAALLASPRTENTGVTSPQNHQRWDYRVYCYERQQGEWLFAENVKGSFNYQREYVLFNEGSNFAGDVYHGWMDQGKLHFTSLEEAQDFVDVHVRTKDDINLVDSIYDIYYVDRYSEQTETANTVEYVCQEKEIKVAHYWFNGDTGRQICWVNNDHSDWGKTDE